jgi:hypothetical protein
MAQSCNLTIYIIAQNRQPALELDVKFMPIVIKISLSLLGERKIKGYAQKDSVIWIYTFVKIGDYRGKMDSEVIGDSIHAVPAKAIWYHFFRYQ